MLGPKYMQGCMAAFVLLSIVGLIFEGAYLGAEESNLINDLTKWTVGQASWLSGPIVFASVLVNLPSLLAWDYAFFTSLGSAGTIMRLILGASISFGVIWGFLTILLPVLVNVLVQLARGVISIFRPI